MTKGPGRPIGLRVCKKRAGGALRRENAPTAETSSIYLRGLQTATKEVMASVMAAEAARMARMAVGAFIDVLSNCFQAKPDP